MDSKLYVFLICYSGYAYSEYIVAATSKENAEFIMKSSYPIATENGEIVDVFEVDIPIWKL